jgi:membrane protease YdiL (CAAX protease family)
VTLRFFLLAYGITWSALAALAWVGAAGPVGLPAAALLALLAAAGPSLAALLASAAEGGRAALGDLVRGLAPRARDAGWMTLALLVPAAAAAAATLTAVAEGMPPGPMDRAGLAAFLPRLAPAIVAAGLGEELGWRGFALPRLQRALHPLAATLLLGLLWAGWHAPSMRLDHAAPAVSWPAWTVEVVSMAVVLTWIWNRSGGSLPACALLHGSADAARETLERALPLLWTNGVVDEPLARTWGAAALALIVLTRGRLGHRPEEAAR